MLSRFAAHRLHFVFVAVLLASGLIPSTTTAGFITPNGNPTAASPAGDAVNGFSYLLPDPAVYITAGGCPWLQPALNAEGFNAANGWTINTSTLAGGIEMDTYLPWTQTAPAITQGTGATRFSFPADPEPGQGGAEIGLGYKPNAADPSGAGVHWIQVIHTNDPSAFGTRNGVTTNGFTNYIDNGYNSSRTLTPPTNPFYDDMGNGYAGNQNNFVDVPNRTLKSGDIWEAQVFVSTWNPNDVNNVAKGGTINIYDGVWWGFTLPPQPAAATPEPSSLTLLGIGAFGLAGYGWRRRKRAAA